MGQNPLGVVYGQNPSNALVPLKVDSGGALITTTEGGGDAVTIADGANVSQGAVADAAWSGSGSGTMVAILKAIYAESVSQIGDLAGTYTNLAANATTNAIKSGAGVLIGISINTKGATGNILTVYDGLTATGTEIGIFDTTANVSFIPLNAKFLTGLSVIMGTGTAANITLVWR